MQTPAAIERAALERVRLNEKEICDRMEKVLDGNPLAAEPNEQRLVARLQTKASLSREEAMAVADGVHRLAQADSADRTNGRGKRRAKRRRAAGTNGEAVMARIMLPTNSGGAERIYGSTIDFVGIAFLQRGCKAARAVARVAFRDGRAQGSGVMVSDRLFLTNNHVIPSAEAAAQFCIEFDYELDPADRPLGISRFAFAPGDLFITDGTDDLDYTLIAVGSRLSGPKELSGFGWCALNNKGDKHALGEVANIVQHPDGRYKEVVLRENRLVNRLDTVLHYVADTEPGSSGSPVFNNEWRMIALHHWGAPWRQQTDAKGRRLPSEVNEGIRVSAIVSELLQRQVELGAPQRQLLKRALELGNAELDPPDAPEQNGNGHSTMPSARLNADGVVTWQVPFELSVRLPWQTPPPPPPPAVTTVTDAVDAIPLLEATLKPSKNYENRSGYKPAFITGFTVDLPKLSAAHKEIAAKNKQADAGDDPFELKYHHFSVVMNGKRRLAFYTACNIDGSRSKHVDRKTGVVTRLEPDDPGLEALIADAEGAEASETWFDDDRLDPGDFAGKDVYEKQVVDGFPSGMGRTLRMFQRGHLVRRMDPAWGTDNQALVADADTFHWTNACPQVGFFNMGLAKSLNVPGTGGGRLWRAIENYVLRNAVADKERVSVFTGPVFRNNDRKFRSIKIPGLFWKIVAWADDGELRSAAMIADQRPVIKVFPEAMGDLSEAFADQADLNKVKDFLTTVKKIEELTGLKFSADVKAGDINAGAHESMTLVRELDAIELRPRRRTGRSRRNHEARI
jgi:endonuclease G, mitochondrial